MEPCLFRHGKRFGILNNIHSLLQASMEPCLFRHGKQHEWLTRAPASQRLQWSHVFSDMVRSDGGGNGERGLSMLQWSHVFSDMVRGHAVARVEDLPRGASMEPCLFRHGKAEEQTLVHHHLPASMEPCLFRHGKETPEMTVSVSQPCFNGAMSFQTW